MGTFSIDVSARPLHTRQLSMQIHRILGEGRCSAASSCQKIGIARPQCSHFSGVPNCVQKVCQQSLTKSQQQCNRAGFTKTKKILLKRFNMFDWILKKCPERRRNFDQSVVETREVKKYIYQGGIAPCLERLFARNKHIAYFQINGHQTVIYQ